MGLESTRAKATLTADSTGFTRATDKAIASMDRLGSSTGKVSSAVGAAMAFSTGFGIVQAIRGADAILNEFIDNAERRARAVSRGAGGTTAAGELRAMAARARGEAANPFRFVSSLGRLAAGGLAAGAANVFGTAETARLANENLSALNQTMMDLINSSDAQSVGQDLLAANMEAFARRQTQGARGLVEEARGVGLTGAAESLERAIIDGITDTIVELSIKLRTEIGSRVQERAVYDDFLR